MKLNVIKRDRARSEGGVWWDFETAEQIQEPHEKHLCLLIAERGNPKFRDAIVHVRMQRGGELRSTNGDDGSRFAATLLSMENEALAEAVLLDWRNMEDDGGETIAYSKGKAMELLADPSLWPLRTFVVDVSGVAASYREQEEKRALGN
jgi:hypothetical protein